MTTFFIVADGERDFGALKELTRRVCDDIAGSRVGDIGVVARPWLGIRVGVKGYGRKLRFAVQSAHNSGAEALVAVVDRDVDPHYGRLMALRETRADLRLEDEPLPIALGCADPHGEAWLVGDSKALRDVFNLDDDAIKSEESRPPKERINSYWERCGGTSHATVIDAMIEIARCAALPELRAESNRKANGWREFEGDLRKEVKSLFG